MSYGYAKPKGYEQTFVINYAQDGLNNLKEWLESKMWFKLENYLSFSEDDKRCNAHDIPNRTTNIKSNITLGSRLYIIGHGMTAVAGLGSAAEGGQELSLEEIAKHLSSLLMNQIFFVNQGLKNLTISLIVCYGAASEDIRQQHQSFAAQLQIYLRDRYNVWINILARPYMVTINKKGKFTINEDNSRKFYIAQASGEDTRLFLDKKAKDSKYYFFWTRSGKRHYVDAYYYKQVSQSMPDFLLETLGTPF